MAAGVWPCYLRKPASLKLRGFALLPPCLLILTISALDSEYVCPHSNIMTSSSSLAPPGSGSHVESSQDKTPSSEPSPIVFSPRTEFDSARSKEVIEHSEPSSIKSPSPEERFTRLQYNNTGPRLVFHWDPGFSETETRRTEASLNAQPGDDNALDPDALADLMTPYEDSTGQSRKSRIPKPLRFLGSGKRTKSDRTLFSSFNPQSSLAVVPTITSGTAPETFDETAIPTEAQLTHAASLTVVSEAGVPINFGSLWSGQKTIVAFIRHFWCALFHRSNFDIQLTVFTI